MFLWMDEKRSSYLEKYPEMSITEITRNMAQAWNKLSDEKKVIFGRNYAPLYHTEEKRDRK